jgi:hypothetical protein
VNRKKPVRSSDEVSFSCFTNENHQVTFDMNDVGQENPNVTQIMPSSLSSNSAKFGYKSLSLASYKKTSSCLCLPAFYNTNNSQSGIQN